MINAGLQDLIKMADVIITFKVNLESPETDIEKVKVKAAEKITAFGGEIGKTEVEEIAFGLKAINFIFVLDEDKGSTESLEDEVANFEEVSSVEITDVRRAIG